MTLISKNSSRNQRRYRPTKPLFAERILQSDSFFDDNHNSPPSPDLAYVDELERSFDTDVVPASLDAGAIGLKYSLRTSIGDGAKTQPNGPSVMERRELRPNGCHLNVSHWSEENMRRYMEDR